MYPNIDAERARKKMSQERLCEQLNISTRTFRNWMSGETEIPANALILMSEIFGCSIDYLLGVKNSAM